ncbi:MAG: hypothetical protein RPT25_04620 [Cycloclasticus sp.]|jgi:hypothetical protein
MQVEENKKDPWISEPKGEGNGFFKSIYDFLSSLLMGCIGLVTFAVCVTSIFRHGGWLADVSILEWILFFWLIYCFGAIKDLAIEQKRSVFLFRWRLFSLTGWTMFWTALGYAAWFKWGSEAGLQKSFLASNLFEISLLFVVGFGMGLGVFASTELEDKATKESVQGDAS